MFKGTGLRASKSSVTNRLESATSAVVFDKLESRQLMSATASSTPRTLFQLNGESYFSANDGIHGQELWRTDGTTAGTQLFKDFTAGAKPTDIVAGVAFHGREYFSVNGTLWSTDGTSAGTTAISNQLSMNRAIVWHDSIYYVGNGPGGTGLFKSDGTVAGTSLLYKADLATIALDSTDKGVFAIIRDNPPAVWTEPAAPRPNYAFVFSDGTAAGTKRSDLGGTWWSNASVVHLGDKLLIQFNSDITSTVSTHFYLSDGTRAGTQEFSTGIQHSTTPLVTFGDRAIISGYVNGNAVLYATDGTTAGTQTIYSHVGGSVPALRGSNATAAFYTDGAGIVRTDGTAAGTVSIPVTTGTAFSSSYGFAVDAKGFFYSNYALFAQGKYQLFFLANDSTAPVVIANQTIGGNTSSLGDQLLFNYNGSDTGTELWISDGTSTRLLKDINAQPLLDMPSVTSDSRSIRGGGVTQYGRDFKITGSAPADSTVVLFDRYANEVGRGVANSNGVYVIAPSLATLNTGDNPIEADVADANGDASSGGANTLTVYLDLTPPKVTIVNFLDSPATSLAINTSEAINGFPTTALSIVNQTTGMQMTLDDVDLTPSATGYTITFPTFDDNVLPDGTYQVTLNTAGITDLLGNAATAGNTLQFLVDGGVVREIGTTTSDNGSGDESGNDDNNGSSQSGGSNPTLQASLKAGVLRLYGTDAVDAINVSGDGTTLTATINGVSQTFAGVHSLIVSAGAGNDTVDLRNLSGVTTKLYGEAGNDSIFGGAGKDRIYGGDGDDWISGGDNHDTIYGEAGNDRLFGDGGHDYIVGGSGTNVLRGGVGVDHLIFAKSDDYRSNAGDKLTIDDLLG